MEKQEDTFLSHLFELRDRLIKALLSIGIVFVCLFPWAKELYALLAQPLIATLPQGGQMIATDVVGVFLVPMKVALMVAFLIALPYVLYQVWAFVAPALYKHERRLVMPLLVSSTLLFYIGMAFAYFVVFPLAFGFLTHTAPEGVQVSTDIASYLSFVMALFMAFGVAFEVPVAIVLLCWVGGNDLKAPSGSDAGPVLSTLKAESFDQVELLSSYPAERVEPYLAWLREQVGAQVNITSIDFAAYERMMLHQ